MTIKHLEENKPFLSDKEQKSIRTILSEGTKVISDDTKVSEQLNTVFKNDV